MKKIFTLLWLTITAFTFKATAQTTPNCNAEFSVQYINNFTVQFNPVIANDSPFVHHLWNFGDGSAVSQQISPTHTFALPGTYAVVHTVVRYNANNQAVCTQTFTKSVVITEPCNLVVDFSWTATAANPLTIEFHNLSVPLATTDSITWQFGDNTLSHDVNPVHTYANAGTYNVCLIVKKFPNPTSGTCIKYICKTVVVNPPCNLVVDFSWTATTTNPLRIEFHNLSTPLSTTDSIRWTFGDGSTSTDVNPVHTYNAPGTYTVCLRVKKNGNVGSTTSCVREICKTIIVTQPCNLVVDFSWTATTTNPLRIEFHNLTTPIAVTDSVRWTFGDGSSSTDINPVHTYNVAGTYTVCLRVIRYNAGSSTPCIREICKTIVVTQPCNLVVDFNWTATATNPLRIEFHNLTTPIAVTDSVRWTFGDGSSSNDINPVHTYTAPGTYTVCLRVIRYNAGSTVPCIREICKTIVVYEPCNLVVNFSSQPDPNHPLRIKFTNLSTPLNGADSIRWTFGDGSSVSGLQSDPNIANPTHDYANAGTYTVCLRVKKNNSTTPNICAGEKCETIVVTQPCNFTVDFSWQLDSANHRKVYFTNLTNAPTAGAIAVWHFGDGSSATSWNAVHEYAQPGRYLVCLRVYLGTNTTCVREKCDTIFIPNPPPPCIELSKYHFEKFPTDNQKYTFTPDYINTTLQYTWTFGDGTGSHDPIAIHRYAQPGVYVACLTAWRGPDCASTTCHEIRVLPQINCDTAHVSYTYARNPQVPNKIQFYANSTLPMLDQTWTITKVTGTVATPPVILHQNNPVYLFQDTGYYRVCLRANVLGGCVKEYCNYIRIEQVSNACELQAYPNPTSASINVNVYLTQPETIHASVYNSLNILVMDKTQQGFTGNNLVSFNVTSLAAGQYTIRLVYGNRVCYARFQKL